MNRRKGVKFGFSILRENSETDLLYGNLQLTLKHYRVGQMPTIKSDKFRYEVVRFSVGRIGNDQGCSGIRPAMDAHSPGRSNIVLKSSAAYRRKHIVSIGIDLDLSLAIPVSAINRSNTYHASQKPARADKALRNNKILLDCGRVFSVEGNVQIAARNRLDWL